MVRLFFVTALVVLALAGAATPGFTASEQALKLRQSGALSEYAPSEAFLAGNFVADEVEPHFIYGTVKDFVKSRSYPVAWLIEEGEKKRIDSRAEGAGPFECTIYLEEDRPGKVVHYVFIDRSQTDPAQWMAWRKQFHKSKAEGQYSGMTAELEQAAQKGFLVNGELRFIEYNGDLQLKRPEELLKGELKFEPRFDVKQGKALESK